MSKKRNTWIALLLALGMSMSLLAGCSKTISPEDYATTVVATYGDQKIYLDEANFLAKQEQYLMESYYSFLMGSTDFWDYDMGDGTTIAESTKSGVMTRIHQTYVLCAAAEEMGISLTDEDLQKVQEAVTEFKENTQAEALAKMNVSDELLTDIYTKNALANRVWEALVKDIDTEVDYEECRQLTVEYLVIDKSTPEEEEEAEGTDVAESQSQEAEETESQSGEPEETESQTPYEDTEEYAQMEELAKSVIEDLKSGIAMEDERESLIEDSTLTVLRSSDTFGKDEHDDAFGELCRSLATGEYGYVYVEEDGWYVVYCQTDNDEEATQKEIDSVLDTRRSEMFQEKYQQLAAYATKFKVDEDVWAQVNYDTSLYVMPETTAEDTENESASESQEGTEAGESQTETVSGTESESAAE